jgi:hypothetical protein
MARDRQQPYYVIELQHGWAIATYKPRSGRYVEVNPPPPEPDDTTAP